MGDEGYLTQLPTCSECLRRCCAHESSFAEEFFIFSEAVLLELSRECCDRFVTQSLLGGLSPLGLDSPELGGLRLSLLLERVDDASLGPAALGREVAEGAELAVRLESENLESLGDDDALLVVVGEGNALEDLELI